MNSFLKVNHHPANTKIMRKIFHFFFEESLTNVSQITVPIVLLLAVLEVVDVNSGRIHTQDVGIDY